MQIIVTDEREKGKGWIEIEKDLDYCVFLERLAGWKGMKRTERNVKLDEA